MLEKQENEERLIRVITPSSQEFIKEEKVNRDEMESLLVKERQDTQEKTHLEKIFKRLGNELEITKEEKLSKIYRKYVPNEKSLNRKIRNDSGKCLLCFMFQLLLPMMEIINLIGIFSIISVMNCCFTLFINSIKSYIGFGGEYNLYFYKEFYEQTMSESIDFNVMFFMSFIGDFLLQFSGFVSASFIFLLFNFGAFFMIDSFNFINNIQSENKEEESSPVELYNFFNIIYILIFYLLFFIGVGASSMLSQQILVDSHDKLQKYNKRMEKLKKLERKLSKEQDPLIVKLNIYNENIDSDEDEEGEDLGDENENKAKKDSIEIKEEKSDKDKNKEIIEENIDNDNINKIDETQKDKSDNNNIGKVDENILEKIEEVGEIKEKEAKEKKEKSKKEEKGKLRSNTEGKFDYFFMICITTIIGYFGKYYFCCILGYQLFNKEENINYRYFFIMS